MARVARAVRDPDGRSIGFRRPFPFPVNPRRGERSIDNRRVDAATFFARSQLLNRPFRRRALSPSLRHKTLLWLEYALSSATGDRLQCARVALTLVRSQKRIQSFVDAPATPGRH